MKRFIISFTAIVIPATLLNINNKTNLMDNNNIINTTGNTSSPNGGHSKKVLISGASGFIGTELTKSLSNKYEVYTLVRRTPKSMFEIEWNPEKSYIDKEHLEQVSPDIVIHLAGENILGYWTEEKKRNILESRTKGTTTLCDALATISKPATCFISASGCTYYGSNVYEPVDEYSPKGTGFFSDVVEKWEQSINPLVQRNNNSTSAADQQTRIVKLRIGLVLDKAGGLLGAMYYPFLFGLGGVVGSGKQYLPWISLRDAIGVIEFAIENKNVEGPINLTSINPVTNYEFTKTLGSVLNRPTVCWIPETPLRFLLGKDMSEETVLSSQRVIPTKLLNYGYKFLDTNLEDTLKELVKK